MTDPAPSLLIPRDLGKALVEYLKKQPYEQVHSLIGGLLNAPLATTVSEPPKEKP
jgi:hypothetical protein